ncbi:MAG: L-threonylcarbamoyladenylate synthase [Candidatus Dormibacteria bacterium]
MSGQLWGDDPAGVARAARALARGGVIGFPTDTVYGIACAATDGAAVEHLYQIKQRPPGQPLILMAAHPQELRVFACVTQLAEELAQRFWPGQLTLVLRATVQGELLRGGGTVGVRIPDQPAALSLLRSAGPLATTSANRHGEETASDGRSALGLLPGLAGAIQLGNSSSSEGPPSSILDLTRDRPVLLREGRLSARELGVSTAHRSPEIRRD